MSTQSAFRCWEDWKGIAGKHFPSTVSKSTLDPFIRENMYQKMMKLHFIYKQGYYLRYHLHFLWLLSSPYSQLTLIPVISQTLSASEVIYFSIINRWRSNSALLSKHLLAIFYKGFSLRLFLEISKTTSVNCWHAYNLLNLSPSTHRV